MSSVREYSGPKVYRNQTGRDTVRDRSWSLGRRVGRDSTRPRLYVPQTKETQILLVVVEGVVEDPTNTPSVL